MKNGDIYGTINLRCKSQRVLKRTRRAAAFLGKIAEQSLNFMANHGKDHTL